jgi:hypothetical protein
LTIGIDFDNTIALYDSLIYRIALELGIIECTLPKEKKAIRDYIRKIHGNDKWTVLQSIIYGKRMSEAQVADGFTDFLDYCNHMNFSIYIVSHKTQYPAMGDQYDLRESARQWIEENILPYSQKRLSFKQVFFENTMKDKCERIQALGCHYFIDDLEEVFMSQHFPIDTHKILYSKVPHQSFTTLKHWAVFPDILSQNQ